MTATLKVNNIRNVSGTVSMPTSYLHRRLVQRVTRWFRGGVWNPGNNYREVPGSFITITPRYSNSYIVYTWMCPLGHRGAAHSISHWIFFANGQEYARHSRSVDHQESGAIHRWEVPSWGAGKTSSLGYYTRQYSDSNHSIHFNGQRYRDGGQVDDGVPSWVSVEEYLPAWEDTPVWNTAVNTLLATWNGGTSTTNYTSSAVSATNPRGGSVTYSLPNGIPIPNTTINPSTGVLTSTGPDSITTTQTYTITIRASGTISYADRTFQVTVNANIYDGTTSARAALSAEKIKALTGTTTDGVYWINLPTVGAQQIYCIMNSSFNGGGWMMAMKATRGGMFTWGASYWTSANTLNETTQINRNDADAKFHTMNYFQTKDMMAIWPDLGNGGDITGQAVGTIWLENNYYGGTRITPISFFNTVNNYNPSGRAVRGSQWNGGSQFSSQSGAQFYGFNFTANGSNMVRWGFGWNNEGDWGSNDVTGGIGVQRPGYSAGDAIYCCNDVGGFNRSARIEIYVR